MLHTVQEAFAFFGHPPFIEVIHERMFVVILHYADSLLTFHDIIITGFVRGCSKHFDRGGEGNYSALFRRGRIIKESMSQTSLIDRIDTYQQQHMLAAFLFGVFKKYGEDEAGYKAALLTYYAFLSLFPLLLVLASTVSLLAAHHVPRAEQLLGEATAYFPLIGRDIAPRIHGLDKSGLALMLGLLLTLFGARGVADAFRNTLDHLWGVPYVRRVGFPAGILRSLAMITLGGMGLLLAPLVAGVMLAGGHALPLRMLSLLVASALTFVTVYGVIRLGMSVSPPARQVVLAAALITFGIEALQGLGRYIVTRELHHLGTLYGTFAVVLGLFFWLYLQAQVVIYSLEITTVRVMGLWPRSIQFELTTADKRAYALYEARNLRHT